MLKAHSKRLAGRTVVVGRTPFVFNPAGDMSMNPLGHACAVSDFQLLLKQHGVFQVSEEPEVPQDAAPPEKAPEVPKTTQVPPTPLAAPPPAVAPPAPKPAPLAPPAPPKVAPPAPPKVVASLTLPDDVEEIEIEEIEPEPEPDKKRRRRAAKKSDDPTKEN